ncbi:MAG: hypothetical protein M1142_05910 [Patescibacteria group bacterium]|nr:hypothetical protein [Patescibacteria group bacterium]
MITREIAPEERIATEEPEECIHRTYDQIRLRQFGKRTNRTHRLGDVLPSVIEEFRRTTYKPLPPEQIKINNKGYAELAQVVADLENRRR